MDLNPNRQEDCRTMDYSHYPVLAEILYFPGEDYPEKVRQCRDLLAEKYQDFSEDFAMFEEFIRKTPLHWLEEIYMRTFDIQALCCMDVGYVLFGEDYTRGKILANLNKEHHQAGIDCRGELADRLPNVLRLLPRLEDQEKREEMVRYLLKPSIDKMIDEFEPARMEEKDETYQKFHHTVLTKEVQKVTLFRIPLQIVREILEVDFPDVEKVDTGGGAGFYGIHKKRV